MKLLKISFQEAWNNEFGFTYLLITKKDVS